MTMLFTNNHYYLFIHPSEPILESWLYLKKIEIMYQECTFMNLKFSILKVIILGLRQM